MECARTVARPIKWHVAVVTATCPDTAHRTRAASTDITICDDAVLRLPAVQLDACRACNNKPFIMPLWDALVHVQWAHSVFPCLRNRSCQVNSCMRDITETLVISILIAINQQLVCICFHSHFLRFLHFSYTLLALLSFVVMNRICYCVFMVANTFHTTVSACVWILKSSTDWTWNPFKAQKTNKGHHNGNSMSGNTRTNYNNNDIYASSAGYVCYVVALHHGRQT